MPDAAEIYASWLLRHASEDAEPFEELVAAHPAEAEALRKLASGDMLAVQSLLQDRPARIEGRRLGDFQLEGEIGRGGMGIVYAARQVSLDNRPVALKVLPAQLTLDERALARFQREAAITARLKHRGIIDVHAVGEEDGVHFIAMELVEGSSLDRVIERMRGESFDELRAKKIHDVVSLHGLGTTGSGAERGSGSATRPEPGSGSKGRPGSGSKSSASNRNYIETAVKLIIQVAEALQHAHEAGVLHRDVKPSNILVRTDGSAVLTDFGLAREEGLPGVSATGDFAGTPHYVSPEQAMARRVKVDHRSDVFSLGATLYELLTLERAFPGNNPHEVLSKIISKPVVSPQKHNAALAPDLVTIVLKALEKDPDARYASALELAEDLQAFIEYRPIKARRTPTLLVAWRWMQREPARAALVAALAVGIPAMSYLGVMLWKSEEANAAQLESIRAEVEAPREIDRRLDEAFFALISGRADQAHDGFADLLEEHWTRLGGDARMLEAVIGRGLALIFMGDDGEQILRLVDDVEPLLGKHPALRLLSASALRVRGEHDAADRQFALAKSAKDPHSLYLKAFDLLREPPSVQPFKRGTLLAKEQDACAALAILKQGVFGNPKLRAFYLYGMSWAAWRCGDREVAERVANGLLERSELKDHASALFYAGLARLVGAPEDARECFEKAVEVSPELSMPRIHLAMLEHRLGDTDRAELLLEDLGEDSVPRFVNMAAIHYERGDYEEAVESAERALELDRDCVPALDTKGTSLIKIGHVEEALKPLRRAVALEPGAARVLSDLGYAYIELGQLADAREVLDQAARLDPDMVTVLDNQGTLATRTEDFDLALEYFEAAVEIEPSAKRYLDLAFCRRVLRDQTGWLETLTIGQEAFDESVELARELALAHHQYFDKELAVEFYRHALDLSARQPDLHQNLVALLKELGLAREAFGAVQAWSRVLPEDAAAWNEQAWMQIDPNGSPELRDPKEALRCARKAVALSDRKDYQSLDTLALTQLEAGLPEDARVSIEQALALAAEKTVSRVHLEGLEATQRAVEAALK